MRKFISLLWLAIRAQWDLRHADRHGRTKAANHAIRHARLLTSITALHNDSPLMLAGDRRAILAAPIPANNSRDPTRLELWAKRTCTIVNGSKADATVAIQRTHERLTSHFRYRWKKKTATTPPPTHPIHTATAHQPHKKELDCPGPL